LHKEFGNEGGNGNIFEFRLKTLDFNFQLTGSHCRYVGLSREEEVYIRVFG
jgi:hypothetical protein